MIKMVQSITPQDMFLKVDAYCSEKYAMGVLAISEMLEVSGITIVNWFSFAGCNSLHILTGNQKLLQIWVSIRARCRDSKQYPRYAVMGIKVKISKAELLLLWHRDNASTMNKPSFRRIDSFKDYTYSNCRFIDLLDLGSLG